MKNGRIRPGVYRHYKGNLYRVVDVARNSESPAAYAVVYRALYADRELWHRPYEMFTEDVDPDGTRTVPRFNRLPWYHQILNIFNR